MTNSDTPSRRITQLVRRLLSLSPWRKPCGCRKSIGGTPWRKRFATEMKTHRNGGYRVDYLDTVRECNACGALNILRQAWDAPRGTSPHPIWHQHLAGDDHHPPHEYTAEYKQAHSWADPELVDRLSRWDHATDPHRVTYREWSDQS